MLSYDAKAKTFEITDTELYVTIVTLSIQDNAKLLQQLKSGFKTTTNWNKYQSKVTVSSPYLYFLIGPSIERVSRLFAVSFEKNTVRTVQYTQNLPFVEIRAHNIMIDGQKFFNQPVRNDL